MESKGELGGARLRRRICERTAGMDVKDYAGKRARGEKGANKNLGSIKGKKTVQSRKRGSFLPIAFKSKGHANS